MARPSILLVDALRSTAARLAADNCGHLVQTLCGITPARIHRVALEREGDWEALANAYCPTSGYAIDDVISELLGAGLATQDLARLEKLDDPEVLAALPGGTRWLRRNLRDGVIAYLLAWAALLELELPARAAA